MKAIECVRCGSRVSGRLICSICQIGDESPRVEVKKLTIREAVQDLAWQGYHPAAIAMHIGIPEDLVDEILGV